MRFVRTFRAALALSPILLVLAFGCRRNTSATMEQPPSATGPRPVSAAVNPEPAATGSTRAVTIKDESFGIPAFTLRIPAGWQSEGEVIRTVNCSLGDPFLVFNVHSPDQTYGAEVVTPYFTNWPRAVSSMEGCGAVAPAVTASTLLEKVVLPKLRPGVPHSPPVDALPEDGQLFGKQIADMDTAAQQQGTGLRVSGTLARVHLEYTIAGEPVEEWILAETQVTSGRGMNGSQTAITLTRTPKGKWSEPVFSFATSAKPYPAWQQRQMEYGQQVAARGAEMRRQMVTRAQSNMAQAVAQSHTAVDAIHRAGEVSIASDRERMGAMDWSAKGTAAYVGDNYKYRTASGAIVYRNTPAPEYSGLEEVR